MKLVKEIIEIDRDEEVERVEEGEYENEEEDEDEKEQSENESEEEGEESTDKGFINNPKSASLNELAETIHFCEGLREGQTAHRNGLSNESKELNGLLKLNKEPLEILDKLLEFNREQTDELDKLINLNQEHVIELNQEIEERQVELDGTRLLFICVV